MSAPSDQTDFKRLEQEAREAQDSDEDAAAARLAEQLEQEKDRRLEERFLWILVLIIFFNAIIFSFVETWTGPLVIAVVEFVLLYIFVERLGVKKIKEILDRAIDNFLPRNSKAD